MGTAKRPEAYVGVSGVVSQEQQHYIVHQAEVSGLSAVRLLALGAKAVHKTQYLDVPNKYGPSWYPVGEAAFRNALYPAGEQVIAIAQLCLDPMLASDPQYREGFVRQVAERGASWLDALQFDLLPWHADRSFLGFLAQVRAAYGKQIILQCHGEAMKVLTPQLAAKRLGELATAGACNYILFDASHGRGKQLDTEHLEPYLYEAYTRDDLARVGFGVAGGLCADAVRESLPKLLASYPGLSWDAEGKLHPEAEGGRPLDMHLTTQYLQASAAVLLHQNS